TVTLQREPAKGEGVKFGLIGRLHADFESKRLANGVGYVRFTFCFDAQMRETTDAIESMNDAPGLILDLRGNPGGVGAVAMGGPRFLLRERIEPGTMHPRKDEIRFSVNPAPKPFEGPVVVIVDGSTGSTAEILAGGLQAIGRARVVG